MASQKIQFVQKIQDLLTSLALEKAKRKELYDMYFAREYNSGGAAELVFADYSENETIGFIPLADIISCITLLENEIKFYAGTSPANAQYDTSINKVRKLPS